MDEPDGLSVLLAGPHHGMSEAIRDLLGTAFKVVVMVADEDSLFESADRLRCGLIVVDLSLTKGSALDFLRRMRSRYPAMAIIAISVHDQLSVSRSVLAAGASGFVLRRTAASDLLDAAKAVLSGNSYVSPEIGKPKAG